MPKLTKRLVESTQPESKDIILRDSELKGFICKITPKGRRTYMLYYRTHEGRERKPAIGVHGNITCDHARDIARQWLADVSQGGDPAGEKAIKKKALTLEEVSEAYLLNRKKHFKPSSYKELLRMWSKDINPALGKIKVTQLDVQEVSRFHNQNSHRPYAANRMLEAIRSAFNYAVDSKLIAEQPNPCKGVKKYPEKKRERFLSNQEIMRLSAVMQEAEQNNTEHPSVIALVRLLLLTGCRLSEILTLKWSYIDDEAQCLRLPDSKTGAKTVYLSPAALQILEGIKAQPDNPYVIYNSRIDGTHLAPPQKAWRRIRGKAELDDVRLHDLRHSFASIAAASGMSLHMIGALLGHKSTQTTARYAHLIGDPLREATSVISSRINQSLKVKNVG